MVRWTATPYKVPSGNRGMPVELLDANGQLLATLELPGQRKLRTLVAWSEENTAAPAAVRLASGDELDLDERP